MTTHNLIPPKHRRRNNGENTRRKHAGPPLIVALRLAGVAVWIVALAYFYR